MLLRTPNARDGEPRGTQPPEKRLAGGHQPSLADQVEHILMCGHTLAEHALHPELFPTPRAGDGEKGGPNQRGSSGDLMLPSAVTCLPTPTSRDWKDGPPCANVPDNSLLGRVIHNLLPTPAVNDMGAAYTPETWDAWTARMKAAHNNGNGHGNSLSLDAQRVAMDLLPTIRTKNNENRQSEGYGGEEGNFYGLIHNPSRWGKYAAAIARWESVTRPAPEPTNITDGYLKALAKRLARQHAKPVGMRGSLKPRRQLAARFSEWMMGVPLGWITDTPGITRNEALKAAGNGVVPQQAAEALLFLLDMPTGRQIADAHEPDDLFELLALS